jgi:hypothetical protein
MIGAGGALPHRAVTSSSRPSPARVSARVRRPRLGSFVGVTRSGPVGSAGQACLECQCELVKLGVHLIVLERGEDDWVVAFPELHAVVTMINGATDHEGQGVLVGLIQDACEPSRRPLGDLNAGDRDHGGGFRELSGRLRTSQMIGDGTGSGSSGGVGSGGGSGSGAGIGGSGDGGSGVSVGMRALCPGSRSSKRLRRTREPVRFPSVVSDEPVADVPRSGHRGVPRGRVGGHRARG